MKNQKGNLYDDPFIKDAKMVHAEGDLFECGYISIIIYDNYNYKQYNLNAGIIFNSHRGWLLVSKLNGIGTKYKLYNICFKINNLQNRKFKFNRKSIIKTE